LQEPDRYRAGQLPGLERQLLENGCL